MRAHSFAHLPFRAITGGVALTLCAGPVSSQEAQGTDHHRVRVEVIAENLEHPWGLALLPDGRFLVTERNAGQLRLGTPEGEISPPLEGVPRIFRYEGETDSSQAGLFDVKLHPDFEENGLVYLSYSKPGPRGAAMAVVRGRLTEETGPPRLDDVQEIFEMKEEDQDSGGLHFGGRMALDTIDQALFLSIGDRRNLSRAQDLGDQAGSILRMSWEGEPMGAAVGATAADEGLDEFIWSWGHRNPQALGLDPGDGSLWMADHGPQGGDEVNRIERGRNHGWPLYTKGVDYSGAPLGFETPPVEVVPPLHAFDETVAPSGLAFYTGDAFPEWEGDLLIGGLVTRGLVRLRIGADGTVMGEEKMLTDLERRVRDVQVAPDGSVWLITDHSDGEVIRLSGAEP
jgi:aldose sugar dehydrogenase